MQTMPIRIFIVLFILILIYPSLSLASTEQRTALVIGNSAYSSGPLKNPVNDATDMAATLKKLGFKVVLKKNANLETMEGAIEEFGNRLKKGGVGLFYYAGHGVQVNGVNYLIPIEAKINKESDVRYKAVDAGRILDEMANANNGLNIVLLDSCRDNPFGKSFRSASRGLAIVSNAPTGTFISYSTSPGQVARDGEGRNSPYTKSLLQYMQEPGVPIGNVFMKVRQQLRKDTGQVPWELSSLEGDFYFLPGKGRQTTAVVVTQETSVPDDELQAERMRIAEERERLHKENEVLEQKKALEEERRQLAMAKLPSAPAAGEIRRDGRFIAYDNGTVLDTRTNLMWALKDNGSDMNWSNAKSYCDSYRGGGYSDWRMPTKDELMGLYSSKTELIKLTDSWVWAFDLGYNDLTLQFNSGGRLSSMKRGAADGRVLPVRTQKNDGKETPYLGLSIKDNSPSGVIISGVQPGSPAEKAGLKHNDVILQVNRTKIQTTKDFEYEINRETSRESMMLLIRREKTTFFVSLKQK
jgi:hypothetical protein